MTLNEYQVAALVTMKKYGDPKDQIVNAALGLAGESGEVAEWIKHYFVHDGETEKWNRDKLIKELGDIMWYIAEMCDAFDLTLEQVCTRNIEKLRARHGTSFSGEGNRTGAGE